MIRRSCKERFLTPVHALEPLEPRLLFSAIPNFIIAGSIVFNQAVLVDLHTTHAVHFQPFSPDFIGGVNSAVGDINGDGIPDAIFAPASNGEPLIQIYNAFTGVFERNFFAYSRDFLGGVNLAAADINGDGKADIITAPASSGVPLVNVFDGATGRLIRAFYAYDPAFHGGVSLAAADVNGDGAPDIITGAGYGGVPLVNIFSGANNALLHNFYAFNPSFRGGIVVTAGDMEGDGHADIAVGVAFGAAGNVRVFSGANLSLRHEIVTGVNRGVSLALTDYDGDGLVDLITTGKYSFGTVTGYGIYKGTDLSFLNDWHDSGFKYDGFFQFLISGYSAP
jgi:hypothetical protein